MTPRASPIRSTERGAALVAVLVVLMLMSGLAAALAVSATTETLMARNHQVAAQARAVADAGLAHAVALTLAQLRGWSANAFASPGAAVTALLRGPDDAVGGAAANADNGSLEALGIVRPPGRVALAGDSAATYEARVLDDDDPALGRGLSAAAVARIGEDGQAATDANHMIVVRSTGYAGTTALPGVAGVAGVNAFAPGAAVASGAVAVVEASIGLRRLPAVLTNGTLILRDAPLIGGALGSVHANGDLNLVGTPMVSADATSSAAIVRSGTPVVGGTMGHRPALLVPPVRAATFRPQADFVLTAGGVLQATDGTAVCDASAASSACADAGYAWVFGGVSGWSIPGAVPPPAGTYYVEGDAAIPGNPGSAAAPARMTVIAEGSISITGAPVLTPDAAGVLLVAGADLLLTGAMASDAGAEARILVREQAQVGGAAVLAGQLLVEDDANVSGLVTATVIGGNATITYSGAGGTSDFVVTAWRRVEVR